MVFFTRIVSLLSLICSLLLACCYLVAHIVGLQQARSLLDDARNYRTNIQAVYGSKYEYLKGAIPNQKENVRYNFQQASYSWDSGNKSAASDFSQEGKRLKAELQEMYADKEVALSELKAAGERFRQALDVFNARKAEFEAARDAVNRRYDELKLENERKRKEREAREREREQRRQQEAQKREQELAETRERQRRWQHVQAQRQALVELAKSRARQRREEERKANRGPKQVQDKNADFHVQVRSDWAKDEGVITTDIVISPRDGSGDRFHIVIDEYGNEIIAEWHYKNPR